MKQKIKFKLKVFLFVILGIWWSRRGCHRSESKDDAPFLFLSPALVMSGKARTCVRAHTDPICLFFWKLHNCQLLIQWSAAMMLIIIQQSWEMWGSAPQSEKKKHYWNWKKYYISTVREVIMLLSAAVFNIFPIFLLVSLSPPNQCAYSPAGPRWGVISASGLRFHQAFT